MKTSHAAVAMAAFAGLVGSPGCGCGDDENLLDTAPTPFTIAFVGKGYGTEVDVIEVETMSLITTIPGAGGYRMALTPNGNRLYSTAGDNLVYVSDANNFTLITSFDPGQSFGAMPSTEIEAVAVSPSGAFVVVFDEQGLRNGYEISTASNVPTRMLSGSAFDEPENCFYDASGGSVYMTDNGLIWKVDVGTFATVGSQPTESDSHGLSLSADGARAFCAGPGGGMDVFATAGSMSFLTNIADAGCSFSCGYYMERSATGSRIYSVDEGNTLSVYDSVTNTLVTNVTLSQSNARDVTTTPDGSIILIATGAGVIRMNASTLTENGFYAGGFCQSLVCK